MNAQDYLWLTAIGLPAAVLCALTVLDCAHRADLTAGARAAWTTVAIALPVLGSLIYASFEPAQQLHPRRHGGAELVGTEAEAE